MLPISHVIVVLQYVKVNVDIYFFLIPKRIIISHLKHKPLYSMKHGCASPI